jgi:hypothetical protein
MVGITTSIKIRSGFSVEAISTPISPFSAVTHSYLNARIMQVVIEATLESSTIRIFFLLIGVPSRSCGSLRQGDVHEDAFGIFLDRYFDRLSTVAREYQLAPRAEDHSDLHRNGLQIDDWNLLANHAPWPAETAAHLRICRLYSLSGLA